MGILFPQGLFFDQKMLTLYTGCATPARCGEIRTLTQRRPGSFIRPKAPLHKTIQNEKSYWQDAAGPHTTYPFAYIAGLQPK